MHEYWWAQSSDQSIFEMISIGGIFPMIEMSRKDQIRNWVMMDERERGIYLFKYYIKINDERDDNLLMLVEEMN